MGKALGLSSGGVIWLRKEFEVPEAKAGKAAAFWVDLLDRQILNLYLNGKEIGTLGMSAPRFYQKACRKGETPGSLAPIRSVVIQIRPFGFGLTGFLALVGGAPGFQGLHECARIFLVTFNLGKLFEHLLVPFGIFAKHLPRGPCLRWSPPNGRDNHPNRDFKFAMNLSGKEIGDRAQLAGRGGRCNLPGARCRRQRHLGSTHRHRKETQVGKVCSGDFLLAIQSGPQPYGHIALP